MPVKRQKNLSLSFPSDVADQICAFAEAAGLDTMQDAIRSLVAMGLAATPQEGLVAAQSIRVYTELKRYALTTISRAVKEMKDDLDNATRDPEALGTMLVQLGDLPGSGYEP